MLLFSRHFRINLKYSLHSKDRERIFSGQCLDPKYIRRVTGWAVASLSTIPRLIPDFNIEHLRSSRLIHVEYYLPNEEKNSRIRFTKFC